MLWEAAVTGLCASCVCETSDCERVEQDGKHVLLCYACRDGSVRLFTFAGGRDVSRFRSSGGSTINGNMLGEGSRRRGQSGGRR